MIALHRSTERRHERRGKRELWLTFYPQEDPDPAVAGPGALAALDELWLPPGGVSAPLGRQEAEIVTYVHRGALAQEDSTGGSGVMQAGEFQHMTSGRGVRHKETNASRTDPVHLFRISLHHPEVGLDCAREQRRFGAAQRRNVLCVVAAPDARRGSLRTLQDVLIYSSMLDPGHHLIHELLPGRSAWLHLIRGEAMLSDLILTRGDGVGLTSEPSVSLTAQEDTELLLVDLGPT